MQGDGRDKWLLDLQGEVNGEPRTPYDQKASTSGTCSCLVLDRPTPFSLQDRYCYSAISQKGKWRLRQE